MKKSFITAACLLCAAVLQAAVTPFSYYTRSDGTPLLIPQVREYKAGEGSVKIPAAATVAVPKGEELIIEEIAAELKRFPEIKVSAKDGDAFFRFVVTDKEVPENTEGYTLAVTEKGVTVFSRTTDGLFRGAQTVRNLLRNAPASELKHCAIADWPEFEVRGYTFVLRNTPESEFDAVLRTIEALAAFKLNAVFLSLEDAFPFKQNPLTKRKVAYSREKLEQLVDFCRRRHIEIIPTTQIWSHCVWMTSHPDWEKMKEGDPDKLWNSLCCPYNEQARELTRMMIEEQIELYHPKLFYVLLDEIYLGPFRSCPHCRKVPPRKILGDYLAFLREIIEKKHGVRILVCHDSFVNHPRWKYGDWFREQLGKEIYVRWWSYQDQLPVKELAPFKGHVVMGNAICGKPVNVYNMAHLMKHFGGIGCNMTYFYYSKDGVIGRLPYETPDSIGGFVNGADYVWNLRATPPHALDYDGTFEAMRILRPETLTMPPRSGRAVPVPFAAAVNAELSASGDFPRFADDAAAKEFADALAKLPENFRLLTSPGGKYYAAQLAGRAGFGRHGIGFAFGKRKAEQLSLLLTASRPANGMDYYCARIYGKKRFAYEPAAHFTIQYADGSKHTVPLGYRKELTDWNRPFGGYNMRMAVRGFDAARRFVTFGICDVRNPHPEKPIASFSIHSDDLDDISVALLAMSAWEIDRPFRNSGFAIDPAEVVQRSGVKSAIRSAKYKVSHSFNDGMGGTEVIVSPALRGIAKSEIVDDPASPAGGKVLKITIPGGKYRTGEKQDGGYLRVTVRIPCRLEKGTKSLVFDGILKAKPEDFSRCNIYLQSEGDAESRSRRVYHLLTLRPQWTRTFNSYWTKEGKVLKDITQARYAAVSFFFRDITEPVEIRIGDLGGSELPISSAPVWVEGGEAEPI